jgi:hypothetical protein
MAQLYVYNKSKDDENKKHWTKDNIKSLIEKEILVPFDSPSHEVILFSKKK